MVEIVVIAVALVAAFIIVQLVLPRMQDARAARPASYAGDAVTHRHVL
jgi:NAD(P)-dependent dehydrogenase (short-subunit alcohol dehydrogenase family)